MDRTFEKKAAVRAESGGFQMSDEGRSASVYGQDAQRTSQSYRVVRGEQLCGTLERDVCMDWKIVSSIAAEICNQLCAIHEQGMSAGDLTPANVVVEYKGAMPGTIRLLCDGIGNNDGALLSYKETASLFRPGVFASPEYRKKGIGTAAADVYSIGAIMYACITGTPCEDGKFGWFFRESSICESLSHFDVPEPLARVIARCLAPDPRKRFKNAADLRLAILHPRSFGRSKINKASGTSINCEVRRNTVMLAVLMAGLSAVSYILGALPPLIEKAEQGRLTRNTYAAPEVTKETAAFTPAPEISFEKARSDYRTGDALAMTIGPPVSSFKLYLFYIDEKDNAVCIYPSKTELRSHQSASQPKWISSVGDNKMYVNAKDGKFVLVSVNENAAAEVTKQLLFESDWSAAFPVGHSLNVSGSELLARIERLQQRDPRAIAKSVEDAPKGTTQSLLSQSGE